MSRSRREVASAAGVGLLAGLCALALDAPTLATLAWLSGGLIAGVWACFDPRGRAAHPPRETGIPRQSADAVPRRAASVKARMRQAVEEARRLWPQFIRAFEEREEGQQFSVRAPMAPGSTDLAWVTVTAIENGIIYGRAQSPGAGGQRARIKVDDVYDWMYTEGSGLRGGFTLEADKR